MHWEQFKGSWEAPSAAERAQAAPARAGFCSSHDIFVSKHHFYCLVWRREVTPKSQCLNITWESFRLSDFTFISPNPLVRVQARACPSGDHPGFKACVRFSLKTPRIISRKKGGKNQELKYHLRKGGKFHFSTKILLSNSPASSMSTLRGRAVCDVWSGCTFLGKTVWFHWEARFGESCPGSNHNPTVSPLSSHQPTTSRQALGSASKASNHSSRGNDEVEKWILGQSGTCGLVSKESCDFFVVVVWN